MGSKTSRLENRWWEAEAQRKLATTKHMSKVVVICSLIPGVDETAMVGCLKRRSDLDTFYELYCRPQNTEQHANLTVDSKANELWRVLHMPLASLETPWDLTWRPPFKGSPSTIAAEFHATVCGAIFQVPFFDFVKYALGYNTKVDFLRSLLQAVCDDFVEHSRSVQWQETYTSKSRSNTIH
ncbi:hypothetical protein EAF04_005710 [Stromatinia cepivora]|nr:hypothetical protein EAF04_005710 [Stromatinia cepivora]